ncbi:MAG: HD domain-containing protein [Candidatus Omnitrophica bacterium]|nr:HD domain-containing protein [Candidatus Omnitrophota bacterium]
MVRFSDILKKQGIIHQDKAAAQKKEEDKEALKPHLEAEKTSDNSLSQVSKAMSQPGHKDKGEELHIVKVMKETQLDESSSKNLYSQGIDLIKWVILNYEENRKVELKHVRDLVEKFVNFLFLGDKTLITLFHDDYLPQEYLYNHMVNVMIMSVGLGLELGYNKSQLNELGVAAFVHDIDLASKKLEQSHPKDEKQASLAQGSIKDEINSAIKEQHEEIKNPDFPYEIKGEEVSVYAKIIAIADIYEALTHSRGHRKRYAPYKAITEMLSVSDSLFDMEYVKTLINQVGIYPIGSWTELNTSEVAKVVESNINFPLRPIVSVMFTKDKGRLDKPRLCDLSKQLNLFIKRPLSDEEVAAITKEKI